MKESYLEEARSVFDSLHRIMHAITADVQRRAGELELTMHQAFVMKMLQHGPLSMAEVAERLQVTPATTTGFIDRLVQKDLVRRIEDPADRRVVRVELTDRGRKLLQEFERLIDSRSAGLLTQLEPAELAALKRGVEAIESRLEGNVPEKCPWPHAHPVGQGAHPR